MFRLVVAETGKVAGFFTKDQQEAIKEAVREAESKVGVEFKVAVARARGRNLLKLASRVYRKLEVGAATRRPGVLVLVLPARREFVIWGSEQVNAAISQEEWCQARDAAVPLFRDGKSLEAVQAMLRQLVKALLPEFPPVADAKSEIGDEPTSVD